MKQNFENEAAKYDSPHYKQEREKIAKEVNTLKPFGIGYAPISNGSPNRTTHTDYSVFKKDMQEKSLQFTLQKSFKENRVPNKKMELIGRYQF